MFHRNSMISIKENIKQKLKNTFNSYKALSTCHLLVSPLQINKDSFPGTANHLHSLHVVAVWKLVALKKHTCVSHSKTQKTSVLSAPLWGGCLQEDAVPSFQGCVWQLTVDHNGQQKLKGSLWGAAVQTVAEDLQRTCSGLNERQTRVATRCYGRAGPRAATCCTCSAAPRGSCSGSCARASWPCSRAFPCLRATLSRSAEEKWSMCLTVCKWSLWASHTPAPTSQCLMMSCCWHTWLSAVQLVPNMTTPGSGDSSQRRAWSWPGHFLWSL